MESISPGDVSTIWPTAEKNQYRLRQQRWGFSCGDGYVEVVCINCGTCWLEAWNSSSEIVRRNTNTWPKECSCRLTSPSTENAFNQFQPSSCTGCRITSPPLSPWRWQSPMTHLDPTLVPDIRFWPRLMCSITQGSPCSVKHYFALLFTHNLSIYIIF